MGIDLDNSWNKINSTSDFHILLNYSTHRPKITLYALQSSKSKWGVGGGGWGRWYVKSNRPVGLPRISIWRHNQLEISCIIVHVMQSRASMAWGTVSLRPWYYYMARHFVRHTSSERMMVWWIRGWQTGVLHMWYCVVCRHRKCQSHCCPPQSRPSGLMIRPQLSSTSKSLKTRSLMTANMLFRTHYTMKLHKS